MNAPRALSLAFVFATACQSSPIGERKAVPESSSNTKQHMVKTKNGALYFTHYWSTKNAKEVNTGPKPPRVPYRTEWCDQEIEKESLHVDRRTYVQNPEPGKPRTEVRDSWLVWRYKDNLVLEACDELRKPPLITRVQSFRITDPMKRALVNASRALLESIYETTQDKAFSVRRQAVPNAGEGVRSASLNDKGWSASIPPIDWLRLLEEYDSNKVIHEPGYDVCRDVSEEADRLLTPGLPAPDDEENPKAAQERSVVVVAASMSTICDQFGDEQKPLWKMCSSTRTDIYKWCPRLHLRPRFHAQTCQALAGKWSQICEGIIGQDNIRVAQAWKPIDCKIFGTHEGTDPERAEELVVTYAGAHVHVLRQVEGGRNCYIVSPNDVEGRQYCPECTNGECACDDLSPRDAAEEIIETLGAGPALVQHADQSMEIAEEAGVLYTVDVPTLRESVLTWLAVELSK